MRIDFFESLPARARELIVLDMHTAGEPVRIFDARGFNLGNGSLLSKRRKFSELHDDLRRKMMLEPRGHAEMYGAVLVEPTLPNSDAAVIFSHNGGYSTMCGHASIALGRLLHDSSRATGQERTEFQLECPCGPVKIFTSSDGQYGFDAVPSFCNALDARCDLPGYGSIDFDIGYGGAFYAIVADRRAGLSLETSAISDIRAFAQALTAHLRATRKFQHPSEPDLSFLYGTIVTDGSLPTADGHTRNLCYFGEGQIDRSPTGSGVSARLAVAVARGSMTSGDTCSFAGPSGQCFGGKVKDVAGEAIMTHVTGSAFYTGLNRLLVEPGDPLAKGFDLAARSPIPALANAAP